jgi:hypothetical protein
MRHHGLDAARDLLRNTFGHADFRGLQAGVIGEILGGRSALAVLPTGGGKSLCYQIPSLVRPGLGLVVSRQLPQSLRVMPSRIGGGVDGLGAGFPPRQRQHHLHGCEPRAPIVAGTGFAHLAVDQACAAPGWLVAGPTRETEAATPEGRRSGLLRPSVCAGSSAGPCGCACPLP